MKSVAQIRNRVFELAGQSRALAKFDAFGVALPILMLVSIALLILSRLDHSTLRWARWQVAQLMTPAVAILSVPTEPVRALVRALPDQVDLNAELTRLRNENQRLSGWEWRARELQRKLGDLASLSRAVPETNLNFITGRVIGEASGAFARSVVINAGDDAGVKSGFPVINGDGLVGRVVETGRSSARVLLATDANSHIPVSVGHRGARAVLVGDNGSWPHLVLIDPDARIEAGDDVSTSGVGGLFPRGLRIGTVQDASNGPPRVQIKAMLDHIEYVSVLIFDSPEIGFVADAPLRPQRPQRGKPATNGVATPAAAKEK